MNNEKLFLPVQELWAKTNPDLELWKHLIDVGNVCGELLKFYGPIEDIPDNFICSLVALHDLGKADPNFQALDQNKLEYLKKLGVLFPDTRIKFHHEVRSEDDIRRLLQSHDFDKDTIRSISLAILSHHSRKKPELLTDNQYEEWNNYRKILINFIFSKFGVSSLKRYTIKDNAKYGIYLAGLIVLSDWIASNHKLFKCPINLGNIDSYEDASKKTARYVIQKLDFVRSPNILNRPLTFNALFPEFIPSYTQRIIDELISTNNINPGMVFIEDEAGNGKSESAFILSEYWKRETDRIGIYFALPSGSASNQMYQRYSNFKWNVGNTNTSALVHSRKSKDCYFPLKARTTDDKTDSEDLNNTYYDQYLASKWFNNNNRVGLLSADAIGTVDQLMLSVLHTKFGFLRFLGLSKKVVIIDEIHSYDDFMILIISRLLNWLSYLKIPVILLSATLSTTLKRKLISAYSGKDLHTSNINLSNYPMVTHVDFDGNIKTFSNDSDSINKTIYIEKHPGLLNNIPKIAELVKDLNERGNGCICVILNTVKHVQELYDYLLDKNILRQDTEVDIYHSRFELQYITEIEKDILSKYSNKSSSRPKSSVLICTQVIEQSLDIDFDVMITDIAPIDVIIQRCGRLHRHKGNIRSTHEKPVLHINLPEFGDDTLGYQDYITSMFGSTARVYINNYVLLKTFCLLQNTEVFEMPVGLRAMISAVYDEELVESEYIRNDILIESKKRFELHQGILESSASKFLFLRPRKNLTPIERVKVAEEDDEENVYATTRYNSQGTREVYFVPEEYNSLLEDNPEAIVNFEIHKVQVPSWWLSDSNVMPVYTGEPNCVVKVSYKNVLYTIDSRWNGILKNGKNFCLISSKSKGIIYSS